jgi:hypothetical protein
MTMKLMMWLLPFLDEIEKNVLQCDNKRLDFSVIKISKVECCCTAN